MRSLIERRRPWLAAVAAVTMAFGVAACGSDDGGDNQSSGSGGNIKGSGTKADTGSRADEAKKFGEEAAKAAGEPVKLEPKTIGIINFLGGIESSDRLKSTAERAAKLIGYKTIVCDGKGTPTVFVTCGNSLLDQGVDGILEIAIEPATIQPVLDKAKKQGVPVVQIGGAVPQGDLDGNYGPDEVEQGKILSDYLFKQLEPLDGNPGVVIHNFPASWGATRTTQFQNAVKEQDKIKILATTVTDSANLVQSTRKIVGDQITQYPDAKAYWFTFDTTGQVGGQVIQSKYAGKEFPEKPLVATFHADLGTLDLMRKGAIDVTSEGNYGEASWIGIDQLAEYFARKTEISKDPQPEYPGAGDLFTYQIITKDNLPPEGEYVPPRVDVVSFFTKKWQDEFGIGGA